MLPSERKFAVGTNLGGRFYVSGIEGGERAGDRALDRKIFMYNPQTDTWESPDICPGPVGDGGQFLLRPLAALPVLLDGSGHILTLGHGHLYTDDTVKPAGTIDAGPPYIYTP